MTLEETKEYTKNASLLYDIINDFIDKNEMQLTQVIGVLETIKLELMIEATDGEE